MKYLLIGFTLLMIGCCDTKVSSFSKSHTVVITNAEGAEIAKYEGKDVSVTETDSQYTIRLIRKK